MKLGKLENFKIDKIPRNMNTYVLKIEHEYCITQFYRTIERFTDKLTEYYGFNVVRIDENKNTKTYTMEINGKLTNRNKIGRPRKEVLNVSKRVVWQKN